MYPYTPLWKRGARGDFTSIILKSPFIPLCQRGIKTPVTEGLQYVKNEVYPIGLMVDGVLGLAPLFFGLHVKACYTYLTWTMIDS